MHKYTWNHLITWESKKKTFYFRRCSYEVLETTDNTVGQNHNFPEREGITGGEVLSQHWLCFYVSLQNLKSELNVVYTNIIILIYKFWIYLKGSPQVPSTLKHAFLQVFFLPFRSTLLTVILYHVPEFKVIPLSSEILYPLPVTPHSLVHFTETLDVDAALPQRWCNGSRSICFQPARISKYSLYHDSKPYHHSSHLEWVLTPEMCMTRILFMQCA